VAASILKNSKSWYLDNGLTDRHEASQVLATMAWWRNSTLMMRPTVRNFNFKIQHADGRHSEKKSPYIGCSFSDLNKIWQGDAVRPSWPFGPLQIWNLKQFKMAAADILKN